MAVRTFAGVGLLALLIGAMGSGVAAAKKPPSDPTPAATPVAYDIHWLGELGHLHTMPKSVNGSGTVVGTTAAAGYEDQRAFICVNPVTNTAITDLTDCAWNTGPPILATAVLRTAARINNDGRIAGEIEDEDDEGNRLIGVYAWDYPDGDASILYRGDLEAVEKGEVQNMWVSDMNENGVVLGGFKRADGSLGVFVWTPGFSPIVVNNLADRESPSSMNNDLIIVGRQIGNQDVVYWWQLPSDIMPSEKVNATPNILPDKTLTLIGTVAINNSNLICASIQTHGDLRPAKYDLESSTDWEMLAGNYKMAGFCEAMNNQGQICALVGASTGGKLDAQVVVHPDNCFWQLDLPDEPDVLVGARIEDISDVDNSDASGIIVGRDWIESRYVGFVLMPQE